MTSHLTSATDPYQPAAGREPPNTAAAAQPSPDPPQRRATGHTPSAHHRPGSGNGPLDVLEGEFTRLIADPGRFAIHGTQIDQRLPERSLPLDELRDLLFSAETDIEVKDAAWRVLAGKARTEGGDWVLAAAGAALPALRRTCDLVGHGYGADAVDLDAEVRAGFLLALLDPSVELEGEQVLWRLCGPGRAAARQLRYTDTRHVPFGDLQCPDTTGPPQSPEDEDEAAVLQRVVAAGVITTGEAELIGRTRLNGQSMAGVAAATGESPWALQRRRHRAETRLRAAVEHPRSLPAQPSCDLRAA
ncbi:MAG: hypothetical protein ACRDT6_02050 [Micromonosporaceae bacterium]